MKEKSFLTSQMFVCAAKRRIAEVMRNDGGSATPSLTSAEEDVLHHREGKLRVEVFPGGTCSEPISGSESSFMSGRCSSSFVNAPLEFSTYCNLI